MRARALLWFGVFLLPLVIGGGLTTPAFAGGDDADREVRAVQEKIDHLLKEARQLQEEGHTEEAREVRQRAIDLRRRLAEYFKRREQERHGKARRDAVRRTDKADAKRHAAVLRGLAQGIEALHALGRKEEAARLARIYEEVKRGHGPAPQHAKHDGRTERQIAEGWIELMGHAVKVLVKAGRHDHAHIVEHGKHALELALAGKHDAKSMKIRKSAPPREKQAHSLLLAAEILRERGDERHAKLLADLGHQWQKKRRKAHAERADAADLESLEQRVAILETALHGLREGERKEAVEILVRAIRTGRVLLAEREDEEARKIVEQTPPLAQIAEVLHLAAELWKKFGHERKAHLVARLAARYTKMAREQRREATEHGRGAEEHERRMREKRARDQHSEALRRLQREVAEMRAALERIQRRLHEIARQR